MLINTTNGSLYFTIFYSLAFFLTFLMLLREGYLRKIPMISWVVLLIFTRVFFIIGTKIFTFNSNEWLQMLQQGALLPTSEKILPGGIILGVIALLAGKYVFRIRQNLLDAFAVIVPIGFGIQKIGCFLNGCCYGKLTTLPWGVQYGANTEAHFGHLNSGLIGANDLFSMHIHPVQLYEMAGAFLIAFVVFRSRKFWKASGSLFIFSILSFCFVRFFTEFFRDVAAHTTGGRMIGIFNQIQWIMIFAIAVLSGLLIYREKKIDISIKTGSQGVSIGMSYFLAIFTFEAFLIWTLRDWLSQSELISIFLSFFISSLIIFFYILNQIISSKVKMIYAAMLVLPLLLTSQTIPQVQSDTTKVIRTKKISFGVASGDFKSSFNRITGTTNEGCNNYEAHFIRQKYIMGGGGFSIKDEYPEKKFSVNYGLNMYLGQISEMTDFSAETKTALFGLNPYVKFDANWLGIGGGFHAGNIAYTKGSIKDDGIATTAIEKTSLYPQAYLRVGPQRFFYVDYRLGEQFPTPFPSFYQQLGIGTGLGTKDANLRFGGFISPDIGAYFSACIPVSSLLSFEPMLVLSSSQIQHFSVGVHYNISSKSFYRKVR